MARAELLMHPRTKEALARSAFEQQRTISDVAEEALRKFLDLQEEDGQDG